MGVAHPDYLCDTLTASQVVGWMQYETEEPFGERRQDLRQRAVAEILSGADGVRFDWPYWPPAMSEYEKLVEAQEIARRMKAEKRVTGGS